MEMRDKQVSANASDLIRNKCREKYTVNVKGIHADCNNIFPQIYRQHQ